jgi:hypothetical protein
MLEGMTSTQVTEWEAMFERWHLGEYPHFRPDLGVGLIRSDLRAVNGGKGESINPEKLMPFFTREREAQSPEQIHAELMSLARRQAKPRAKRGKDKPDAIPTE